MRAKYRYNFDAVHMSMNPYYKKKRKNIMRLFFKRSLSNPTNGEKSAPSEQRAESPEPSTSAIIDPITPTTGLDNVEKPKKRLNFSVDAIMADTEVPTKKSSVSAEHSRSSSLQASPRHSNGNVKSPTEKRNISQPPNLRVS